MSRAARLLRDGEPIDINHASAEELQLLPRIGPALAEGIIASRPFRETRDLQKVRGIGTQTLRRLENLVRACANPACEGPSGRR